MDRVLLVRHAKPTIVPEVPASEWELSDVGRMQAAELFAGLQLRDVDLIVTSDERKAIETGELIMDVARCGLMVDSRIAEQGIEVPWIDEPEVFQTAVARHFADPDAVVLGKESSRTAMDRFSRVVEGAVARSERPALVSHGRIMAAYIGRVCREDPMTIWSRLGMPDVIEVDFSRGEWRSLLS